MFLCAGRDGIGGRRVEAVARDIVGKRGGDWNENNLGGKRWILNNWRRCGEERGCMGFVIEGEISYVGWFWVLVAVD